MYPAKYFWLVLLTLLGSGCFPHHAGPRLAHFDGQAPAVGEPAPRFTLHDLAGNRVELDRLIGEKPIVLRFGSHSCPVYRYRRFSMDGLVEDFQDRVLFLTIYTREAHPVGSKSPYAEGEWDIWMNKALGVRVHEPATLEERLALARESHQELGLAETMAVDALDNSVWEAYGAAASPAFVIDLEGTVALSQPWVVPKEIRKVLESLLSAPPAPLRGSGDPRRSAGTRRESAPAARR